MLSSYFNKDDKNSSVQPKEKVNTRDAIETTKTYFLESLKNQDLRKSYLTVAESFVSRFFIPSRWNFERGTHVSMSHNTPSPMKKLIAPPPHQATDRSHWSNMVPIASCMEVINSFKAPYDTLLSMTVTGIEDNMIFVKHKNSEATYAVKSIEKCNMGACMNFVTVLPQSVPFVVQLKMLIETEDKYFLFFERLRLGKLWNFLRKINVDPSKKNVQLESYDALKDMEEFLPEFQLLSRRPFCALPEFSVRIWSAEILLVLEALHEQGLVWGDLHPGNILLHHTGHVMLTYYSILSGFDVEKPYDCIRSSYSAPELVGLYDPTPAADWWSFGAIIYELLTGEPLSWNIQKGGSPQCMVFKDWLSEEAKDLVCRLLELHPHERLGAGICGAEEIKAHPFFHPVDWSHLSKIGSCLHNYD
ncbi:ribosomal protein S6 kinase delta-1-like [Artemia franciscana]|uniref:Protein kinase domain-containing protein n=1 Tax=Artemia franciscana TaxID=6661 RepID=A0AA88HZ86_ARTSF|nr:hypothetical protein QYM36_007248 [Artemia franciscana]KAK2717037.1 hypothetical protein QYM36_007248 [Artemia franciscana]KAK2717038.1 hypothetical protein QYM36_007248 [Artemia franciscana]